jgi:drug/metabolite transporter (DMT)-like permease
MIELWIPITIAAAFLQNLRSAMQRQLMARLREPLSAEGASYARFLYAVPFIAVYFAIVASSSQQPMPAPHGLFVIYAVVGGLMQILATVCLIRSFAHGSFAVGTAYSKTETLQAAVVVCLMLGEAVTMRAGAGIAISLVGVLLLSLGGRSLEERWLSTGAVYGIVSGSFFAVSIVAYRGAALSLESLGFIAQAAYTQVWVTGFQALVMGVYLWVRNAAELRAVLHAWRPGLAIGASGMAATACWFTAVALENAAYVRAVGQIELLFTFVVSLLFFRERIHRFDGVGVTLVAIGIVLLVLR